MTGEPQILDDFLAVWKLSAKFLVSNLKVIDTVGFCRIFFQVLLEQPLKFLLTSLPSLLTRDDQSQS